MATDTILFVTSIRKDSFGAGLAIACKEVGIEVVHNPAKYLSKLCNKCARKIRKLSKLYKDVRTSLESISTLRFSTEEVFYSDKRE